MNVDKKLSKYCEVIDKVLFESELSDQEIVYILLQMSIKTFLIGFVNNKNIYMDVVSSIYDTLEEEGNILGYVSNE